VDGKRNGEIEGIPESGEEWGRGKGKVRGFDTNEAKDEESLHI
jgi:hypothetical protein